MIHQQVVDLRNGWERYIECLQKGIATKAGELVPTEEIPHHISYAMGCRDTCNRILDILDFPS